MVPLPLVLTPAYGDASELLKTSSEELEQESQRLLPRVSLQDFKNQFELFDFFKVCHEFRQPYQEEVERRRKQSCRPSPTSGLRRRVVAQLELLQPPKLFRQDAGVPPGTVDRQTREAARRRSGSSALPAVHSGH
jgi:hypothetical protein